MLIPMICHGTAFTAGADLGEVSIKDVAPTVTELLGVKPDEEWEGKSFLA
jgi:arylsulfatase A-like enzyme